MGVTDIRDENGKQKARIKTAAASQYNEGT